MDVKNTTDEDINAVLDRAVKLALPVAPRCSRCGYPIDDPVIAETNCFPCSVPEAEMVMWRYELEATGFFDDDIHPAGEVWSPSEGPWFPVAARLDRGALYRLDLALRLAEVRKRREMAGELGTESAP